MSKNSYTRVICIIYTESRLSHKKGLEIKHETLLAITKLHRLAVFNKPMLLLLLLTGFYVQIQTLSCEELSLKEIVDPKRLCSQAKKL